MALAKRIMRFAFQLGEGDFGEGAADQVSLENHRATATIVKAGGNSMGTAQLQIYGMTLAQMNKLSTLGMVITATRKNTVTVSAGDEDGGVSVVFIGQIKNAWGNFQAAPQVPFTVEAHVGFFDAVKPVPASSFRGQMDVAVALQGLATQMNKRFQNNGVNVKMANSYYSGSARDQALAIVADAGIEWNGLDQDELVIWPAGGSRGGQAVAISPSTGMIGYPAFTSQGIMVRSIFNRSVGLGSRIVVDSSLTPANGEWIVYALDHKLDTLVPGGDWSTNMSAARPGQVVVSSR